MTSPLRHAAPNHLRFGTGEHPLYYCKQTDGKIQTCAPSTAELWLASLLSTLLSTFRLDINVTNSDKQSTLVGLMLILLLEAP